MGMTLEEYKEEVRRNLRETATRADNRNYPETNITRFLNAAIDHTVRRCDNDLFKKQVIQDVESGATVLPTDYLAHLEVAILNSSNNWRPITYRPQSDVRRSSPNYATDTSGAPSTYYLKRTGTDRTLYLTPALLSDIEDGISLYYTYKQADLEDDDDEIEMLEEFPDLQPTLPVNYALARLLRYEGGARDSRAQFYWQLYEQDLGILYEALNELYHEPGPYGR